MHEVSIYKSAAEVNSATFNNTPFATSTPEILARCIASRWESETAQLRSLDGEARRSYKRTRLPYATWRGVFSYRSEANFLRPSNLFDIDIDHIGRDLVEDVKRTLASDTDIHTALLFTSPSGEGLKWIIYAPPLVTSEECRRYHRAAAKTIADRYGIEIDPACKDIARACFLCHDASPIFKPYEADTIFTQPTPEPMASAPAYAPKTTARDYTDLRFEICMEKIARFGIDIAPGRNEWLAIAYTIAARYGQSGEGAFMEICRHWTDPNHTNPDPMARDRVDRETWAKVLKRTTDNGDLRVFFQCCKRAGINFD